MRILPFDPPTNWQSTTVKEEKERESSLKGRSLLVLQSARFIMFFLMHRAKCRTINDYYEAPSFADPAYHLIA